MALKISWERTDINNDIVKGTFDNEYDSIDEFKKYLKTDYQSLVIDEETPTMIKTFLLDSTIIESAMIIFHIKDAEKDKK